MMLLAINLTLNICGLLFLVFMMVVYFSKKNMNNIDNKLYRLLLICNFLNSFIHIIYLLFQWLELSKLPIFIVIIRGYWIPVQWYALLLVCYMIYILQSDNKKFIDYLNNNKKKIYSYIGIGLLIIFIIFGFFPFTIKYDGYVISSIGGIANDLFFILFALIFVVNIAALILYRKKENKKKILPFKVLFVFVAVGFTLSAIVPMLCITEFLCTIISYLMFHTIENPDLKLVNELTLAKNEAEKASNAKSDFLSSMSHELRTPLNAIVGLSQMIENGTDIEEMRRDSKDIYKASTNLLELVDGILDINKLESNNMEIENSDYNPYDVFSSIEKTNKIRIGDKPIELRTRISSDIPTTLNGDKGKIKTIINNIISNAVKYTEKGYVDFDVNCIVNGDTCNLRITITDTGRGIRNDQKDKLFTKFYRLEEDKDSDIEGTGLGLAITKSLVELMGGEISVNSTEGMGSTFTVTLNQKVVNSINTEESEIL